MVFWGDWPGDSIGQGPGVRVVMAGLHFARPWWVLVPAKGREERLKQVTGASQLLL